MWLTGLRKRWILNKITDYADSYMILMMNSPGFRGYSVFIERLYFKIISNYLAAGVTYLC